MNYRIILFLISLGFASGISYAYKKPHDSIVVSSAKELTKQLASLKEGTHIFLEKGIYSDLKLVIDTKATKEKPLVIEAKKYGKVKFSGDLFIEVKGSHIQFKGIHFTNSTRKVSNHLIHDTGIDNQYSHCKFTKLNDVPGVFIQLDGQYTKVHHCLFTGKTTTASYMNVGVPKQGGSHHLIFRNYFSRPEIKGNGGSAMRIGHGSMAQRNAYVVIKENLFENCDGENEIISVKSSRNHIVNNTFRTSKGHLSLRQGQGSIVEGNYFLGDGEKPGGGIYVRGENHHIFNNYFYKLGGKEFTAFSFGAASPPDKKREEIGIEARHFPITKNIWVYYNTIVKQRAPEVINLLGGYGTRKRLDAPNNIYFHKNIFHATDAKLVHWKPNMNIGFTKNYSNSSQSGIKGIEKIRLKWRHFTQEVLLPLSKQVPKNTLSSMDIPKIDNYGVFNFDTSTIKKGAGYFEKDTKTAISKPLQKADVGCAY